MRGRQRDRKGEREGRTSKLIVELLSDRRSATAVLSKTTTNDDLLLLRGCCLTQAVKKFGLWGLFTRGLPIRIVMIGTLTGAQWGIYDAFKVFVGLPTTGGVVPAAVPAATELAKA